MDPLDILNKVDAFYNSAWTKLLYFTSALVATVGIIIPILFNWLQNRTLRIREAAIKKELENTFSEKLNEVEKTLTESIETKMLEKTEEIESKISNMTKLGLGGTFLLQGNINAKNKFYKQALLDYCTSATNFLAAGDYSTLQRVNKIIPSIIARLTKAELISLQEEDNQPTIYMDSLKEKNEKGLFSDLIKELQREIKKIVNSENKTVVN